MGESDLQLKELCIHRLAVSSECRGLGHGQRLVQRALARAAQIPVSECAWISCLSLKPAVPFYEKLGFAFAEDQNHTHSVTKMLLNNASLVPEPTLGLA